MSEPERELEQTRMHFRELADFVHAIFWITSLDGSTIYYVSRGYEKLWQRSLEELCRDPRSWLDAVHPEDRERLRAGLLVRNIEQAWQGEYRVLLPDGSTRWIRDRRYPVRDEAGNVVRLAGISTDITAARAVERQLKLTQHAVDNAGDIVFWSRPGGSIVYANESASRLLGYPQEVLLRMTLAAIDKGWAESIPGSDGRWAEKTAQIQESVFRTRDGGAIPVEINTIWLRFDEETYCCSIARDISQRKAAERELARYAQELEGALDALRRRNKELDDFVYVASHDLKEPLRAITTFSHILEQDLGGDLPDDAASDLAFILGAARRMQHLIDDLLALSRAGRAEMKRRPVSLRSALDAALDALSARIRETMAAIEIGELAEVEGDPTLLTQLFQNLISNSLKFSSGVRPEIKVAARPNGESWVIEVSDNGPGVEPINVEKIFQPFRRVCLHPGQEGSGVGLAICRKVVERHGGRIWVESVPGHGARFIFTLPMAAAKETT